MATKKEVLATLEPLLPEGVIINPDDYTKKELEQMLTLGSRGELFDHLIKDDGVADGEDASPRAPRAQVMVEDPELLAKVNATEPIGRRDYIRKRFMAGTHRREITDELGVAYQLVFGATKELENQHHAPGRRGARSMEITVTDPETGEERQVNRSDYIREQYELGRDRSDIAKELGISYGLVYTTTKAIERDPEVVEAYRQEHYMAPASDESEEDAEEFIDADDLDEDALP